MHEAVKNLLNKVRDEVRLNKKWDHEIYANSSREGESVAETVGMYSVVIYRILGK